MTRNDGAASATFDPVAPLCADLAAAYDGAPWHGPSFRSLLDGWSAGDAAARPVAGAHSAWEIVLHVTAWMAAGAQRLDARTYVAPPEDWPALPSPADASAWAATLRALDDAYHALATRVGALTAIDLDGPIAGTPAGARGATVAGFVSELTQHLAYHGGQIALLRRALGAA